jgi:hypothetical protein
MWAMEDRQKMLELEHLEAMATWCGLGSDVAVSDQLQVMVTTNWEGRQEVLDVWRLPTVEDFQDACVGRLPPVWTGRPRRFTPVKKMYSVGGSTPPLSFNFHPDEDDVGGKLAFSCHPDDEYPLLLVADRGNGSVHVVDVVIRGSELESGSFSPHRGYVAGPGSAANCRSVATRGAVAAVSFKTSVRVFRGRRSDWACIREVRMAEEFVSFGMQFRHDDDYGDDKDPPDVVTLFGDAGVVEMSLVDGGALKHVWRPSQSQLDWVDEGGLVPYKGGWLVANFEGDNILHILEGHPAPCVVVVPQVEAPFWIGRRGGPMGIAVVPGRGIVVREGNHEQTRLEFFMFRVPCSV